MSAALAIDLRVQAAEINEQHAACESSYGHALAHAFHAGRLLIEAKDQLGHGEWLPWLSENVAFSEDTAENYMRLARSSEQLEQANSERVRNLSIREALREISRPARRMSAGEMGSVLAGAAADGEKDPLRSTPPAQPASAQWSPAQERKDRRASELLAAAQAAQHDAHRPGLGSSAIARSLSDAARAAQRAAVALDEIALSFER